jgi:hypothetical protein
MHRRRAWGVQDLASCCAAPCWHRRAHVCAQSVVVTNDDGAHLKGTATTRTRRACFAAVQSDPEHSQAAATHRERARMRLRSSTAARSSRTPHGHNTRSRALPGTACLAPRGRPNTTRPAHRDSASAQNTWHATDAQGRVVSATWQLPLHMTGARTPRAAQHAAAGGLPTSRASRREQLAPTRQGGAGGGGTARGHARKSECAADEANHNHPNISRCASLDSAPVAHMHGAHTGACGCSCTNKSTIPRRPTACALPVHNTPPPLQRRAHNRTAACAATPLCARHCRQRLGVQPRGRHHSVARRWALHGGVGSSRSVRASSGPLSGAPPDAPTACASPPHVSMRARHVRSQVLRVLRRARYTASREAPMQHAVKPKPCTPSLPDATTAHASTGNAISCPSHSLATSPHLLQVDAGTHVMRASVHRRQAGGRTCTQGIKACFELTGSSQACIWAGAGRCNTPPRTPRITGTCMCTRQAAHASSEACLSNTSQPASQPCTRAPSTRTHAARTWLLLLAVHTWRSQTPLLKNATRCSHTPARRRANRAHARQSGTDRGSSPCVSVTTRHRATHTNTPRHAQGGGWGPQTCLAPGVHHWRACQRGRGGGGA